MQAQLRRVGLSNVDADNDPVDGNEDRVLTDPEIAYLQRYAQLRRRHLDTTVFSALPPLASRSARDEALFAESMSPSPLTHVFVHVKDEVEIAATAAGNDVDGPLALRAGSQVVVQWRFLEAAINDGRVVVA